MGSGALRAVYDNTKRLAGEVNVDIGQEMAIELLRTVGYQPQDFDDMLETVEEDLQTTLALALARSTSLREFIGNALVSHKQRGEKTDVYNGETSDPDFPAQGMVVKDTYGIVNMIDRRGVTFPAIVVFDWENGTLDPLMVAENEADALREIREQYEGQARR